MLKRNSQFTLIELIVVIVVLGILAAIVIPNISSFSKEARETQYTADARNIQTGYDMFTAKSTDLEAEAIVATAGDFAVATDSFKVGNKLNEEFDKNVTGSEKYIPLTAKDKHTTADGTGKFTQSFGLVDFDQLHPDYLRKVPKYIEQGAEVDGGELSFGANADLTKRPVVATVLLDTKGNSTSVVQFVTVTDTSTSTAAPISADKLAVVR